MLPTKATPNRTHRSFRCADDVWARVRARADAEGIAHMTDIIEGLLLMYAENRVDVPRWTKTVVFPDDD